MTAVKLRDLRCQHIDCNRLDNRMDEHHRQRRAVGPDTPPNLILLCHTCHMVVHAHPRRSRDLGYIVSVHVLAGDIAAVPVWSATWDSWVLLNDDWTITLQEGTRP